METRFDTDSLRRLLLRYLPLDKPVLEIDCGRSGRSGHILEERAGTAGADSPIEGAGETALDYSARPMPVIHADYPFTEKGLPRGDEKFGAVLVAAISWIPDEGLFDFALSMKRALEPHGVLIITSFDTHSAVGVASVAAEEPPRERPAEEIQLLFERMGFRFVTRHERQSTVDGRGYFVLVMESGEGGGIRAVDEIEAIIFQDDKLTTYKLALLRALCEIAQTENCSVRWRNDGYVEVPLGLVVEKWLFYYWPIIAEDGAGDEVAIPQKRDGEREKAIRFRREMRELIRRYGGNMSELHFQFLSGKVPSANKQSLTMALRKIEKAIVLGPVKYTRGAGRCSEGYFMHQSSGERKGVYDSARDVVETLGSILVSHNAWREMCLIGHWISESLILRWAELTSEFCRGDSRQGIKEKMVELLLRRPEQERDVAEARGVFSEVPDLRCTWTGSRLFRSFDVDHIIPYSVIYSNDLWNLVPASREANRSKSDKLVEDETLCLCRERIFMSWEILQERFPKRFELEIKRSLMRPQAHSFGWKEAAFAGLRERVESLAALRGIPRWSPST